MHNGRSTGFTLIEMALVTIVVGLLAMVLLPIFKQLSVLDKSSQGKDQIEAVKNDVIGYAMVKGKLPTSLLLVGNPKDAWGRNYGYWRCGNITEGVALSETICASNTTAMDESRNLRTPGGSVNGTAFVIVSRGHDGINATGWPAEPSVAPNYFRDMNIDETADDLVEYVSINQLKTYICGSSGSGGGSSGNGPPGSTVSFADDFSEFVNPTHTGKSGEGVLLNVETKTVKLSKTLFGNVGGCLWFGGNHSAGGTSCDKGECAFADSLTAYFNFQSNYTWSWHGGGFTFAVIASQGGSDTYNPCGLGTGVMEGYSGNNGVDQYIATPKMAVEFDLYPQISAYDPMLVRRHTAVVYWGNDLTLTDDNRHNKVDASGNGGTNPSRGNNWPGQDSSGIYKFSPWDWFTNQMKYHVRVKAEKSGTDLTFTAWVTNSTNQTVVTDIQDLSTQFACSVPDCWRIRNETVFSAGAMTDLEKVRFGFTMGSSAEMDIDIKDFGIRFD